MIPGSVRDKLSVPFFVVLTFALSWTCWFFVPRFTHVGLNIQLPGHSRHLISIRAVLICLAGLVPGILAIVLSLGLAGRAGRLNLLKQLNPLRARPRCYVFAILMPPAILFVGAFLNILDTGTPFSVPASFWQWLKWALTNLALSPLWEELGWRAFLLPRLQTARTSFHASMLITLIWTMWHLPFKYLDYDETAHGIPFLAFFCMFFVSVSALSIILTWLYNISQGSIVPCIILHGVFNALIPFLVDAPAARDGIMPMVWSSISLCVAAIFLLFLNGENLGRPNADANIVMEPLLPQ